MEYLTLLLISLVLYTIPGFILFFNKASKGNFLNFSLAIGLITHAFLIYTTTISNGINLNFSNSLLIISWVTVFFYYLINRKIQFNGLENLTLIPAILIILTHPLLKNDQNIEIQMSTYSIIHIIIAIFSYSLLTVGAIFSIFILLFEKNLAKKAKADLNFTSKFSGTFGTSFSQVFGISCLPRAYQDLLLGF